MTTVTKERTGQLVTLLPPMSAYDRGSRVVHAAEERLVPVGATGTTIRYPQLTALCGQRGWGAAERAVSETTCVRCRRSRRFREVVSAQPLVGAQTTDSPQDRGLGHGGSDAR